MEGTEEEVELEIRQGERVELEIRQGERKMLTVRPIGLKETCQPDKSSTYTLYCNTCGVVLRKVF